MADNSNLSFIINFIIEELTFIPDLRVMHEFVTLYRIKLIEVIFEIYFGSPKRQFCLKDE